MEKPIEKRYEGEFKDGQFNGQGRNREKQEKKDTNQNFPLF